MTPFIETLLNKATTLPCIPRIVQQILRELEGAEPSPRNIVMLISTDPLIAAKTIALANSPLFSPYRTVGSVHDAVSVLGFNQIRSLVTIAALANAFKGALVPHLEAFWQYSLNTAIVAKTLARAFNIAESLAFTMGLVHAIGELVLYLEAPDSMDQLKSVEFIAFERMSAEKHVFGYSYVDVSAAFIERWDFPESIVRALQACAEQNTVSHLEPVYHENTLAWVLHLSMWRARCQMQGLTKQAVLDSFAMHAVHALGMSPQDVLDKDPKEWTTTKQAVQWMM